MRRILLSFALCLYWLFLSANVYAHDPAPGLWFSPDHDGHGFDLQRKGDKYIVVFYSYDVDNRPVWYLSVADEIEGVLSGTLGMYRYRPEASPPQQLLREPGRFEIDFADSGDGTACASQTTASEEVSAAVFDWEVDGASGSWCVIPLLPQQHDSLQDFTGLWWAGEQDQGWGLSLDFAGEGEQQTEVAVLFYYDSAGMPRWAIGATGQGGPDSQIPMRNYSGYCISCPPAATTSVDAGSIEHVLGLVEGDPAGVLDLDMVYGFEPGGEWSRSASPLFVLSDPVSGFSPMPQTIGADQKVAIENVTLVPMTDGLPKIPRQSVLIEDGVIAEITPAAVFTAPDDAVVVDARGLFLAPGMTEMHLHISVGGQSASEQAGLLMIANGVTTALNMGNSWSFDIPRLGERFETGELIGPTLYAGQVAYGPDESESTQHIVANGPEATAYAETLKRHGFDYLKTYWQLPLEALAQFHADTERLDLPMIGHLPLRQSMKQSMAFGHRMAAHIQEPYASYMAYARNDSFFPGAARVFLDHGSYLTPTLAVFESYVKISGNRLENYNELIAREGQQYQPSSIKKVWRDYFHSAFVQDGDPDDLDDLLAFFYRMAKHFHDAGVPLLIGTDAPGFPGVMSGFGAHEEMRLLQETGIPAAEVFAMATRNAGRFVDDTLRPDSGFGTIEPGKRADLILTRHDPLESLEHLKRPVAVMARGRFWSRAYLQERLDLLIAVQKQQNGNQLDNRNTEELEFGPHH